MIVESNAPAQGWSTAAAQSWGAGHALRPKAGWPSLPGSWLQTPTRTQAWEQAWECFCVWAEAKQVLSEVLINSPSRIQLLDKMGKAEERGCTASCPCAVSFNTCSSPVPSCPAQRAQLDGVPAPLQMCGLQISALDSPLGKPL